ncbi:MAG: TonB-dependent receptor [Sphingomonadaceae bacterium]
MQGEKFSDCRVALMLGSAMLALVATPAQAQRTGENAVEEADDAFGTNVGLETTGIYTERNARGFSPLEAGNIRIDGIYFDQAVSISGRLRKATAIRVGFSAVDLPFIAPTGVVDHKFVGFPDQPGTSFAFHRYYYGGHIAEWDFRLPVSEQLGLTGGFAQADTRQVDGADQLSWGATFKPVLRLGDVEISPFTAFGKFTEQPAKPIIVVRDGYLPEQPKRRRYLGQPWAKGTRDIGTHGVTVKARVTDRISLRGGLFSSDADRDSNFSEIYSVVDGTGLANHIMFADPAHDIRSTSGEMLVGLSLGGERFRHRLFGGYRMRDRTTETGGSDFANFGQVRYGDLHRFVEPEFTFTAPDRGVVKQSSWMAGYIGHFDERFHFNLGVQKARYRASSRDGLTGDLRLSRADPWLYNATVMADLTPRLSVYVATQRGLEDSGVAPENASNRDEQLPATKTTQYEGGVKWALGRTHLVLAAFQIEKPYFTFDEARRFVNLGTRRHRGIEASFAGHVTKRLHLLAGGVLMDPAVTGPARQAGLVGSEPAGVPDLYAQLDANYTTDLLGGLVLTGALNYTGKRAVTTRGFDRFGGKQLTLPGWLRLDLGFRHRFTISGANLLVRASMQNVLDEKHWNVVASDVILPEERRRAIVTFALDL